MEDREEEEGEGGGGQEGKGYTDSEVLGYVKCLHDPAEESERRKQTIMEMCLATDEDERGRAEGR